MITLIHGNDPASSRAKLKEEVENNKDTEIVRFEGIKLTIPEVVGATQSDSLFMTKKTVLIENLLKGPISKEKEIILQMLTQTGHNIVLWEETEIDKRIINKYFAKSKVYTISIPAIIFNFLDSIGTQSAKVMLSQFHEIIKSRDAMFVHVMLLRQWRFLLIAKTLGSQGLSDISPWQAKKFISQSKYFSIEELITSYRQLLQIEYRFKTGLTPLPFAKLLDIFLANI